MPKTSVVRQVVGEILASLCSDDSIQTTQAKFRRICVESSEHNWANILEKICPEMLIFRKYASWMLSFQNILRDELDLRALNI